MTLKKIFVLIIILMGGVSSFYSQSLLSKRIARYHEVRKSLPQIDDIINEIGFSSFEKDTLIVFCIESPLYCNYKEFCVYNDSKVTFIRRFQKEKRLHESDTVTQAHKDYFLQAIDFLKNGEIDLLKKKSRRDIMYEYQYQPVIVLFCENKVDEYQIRVVTY